MNLVSKKSKNVVAKRYYYHSTRVVDSRQIATEAAGRRAQTRRENQKKLDKPKKLVLVSTSHFADHPLSADLE